jgi:rhomboid protease GluP
MEQQGVDDTGAAAPATGAHPRDGSIDFSRYSLGQLKELQETLDRRAFPRNYATLLAELEKRSSQPRTTMAGGRFTPHDGWRGWWNAVRRGQPLYGTGSVEVKGEDVVLQGWRRTWLGVPQQTVLIVPAARVRNVACDEDRVRLEWARRFWRPGAVELRVSSAEAARDLAAQLPAVRTPGFEQRWAQLQEYERRLAELNTRPWVTLALVCANLAVFVALVVKSGRPAGFDLQQLLDWGADFGPLTLHGQPWRVFSALFLHFDMLHVALNMWVLWGVGRLAERLYGSWVYLLLYFCSGLVASGASLAWNLATVSIGASGAIFGVLGAFLAFVVRRRSELPGSLWRSHAVSTAVFVLFSLFSGAFQPLTDNAAHLGGLVSGLAIGAVLARPLSRDARGSIPFKETLAALMLSTAGAGMLLLHVGAVGTPPNPVEQWFRSHEGFAREVVADMRLWQGIGARMAQGTITNGEAQRHFREEILPFWQRASKQLDQELRVLPAAQLPPARVWSQLARLRVEIASDVVALVGGDSSRQAGINARAVQASMLEARIERLQTRSTMDYMARSLSQSPWALAIRRRLPGQPSSCIEEPAVLADASLAPTDARSDGPAMSHTIGCRAQQLFLAGDYRRLHNLIRTGENWLADQPDGSSSLAAVYSGLSRLFSYSRLSAEEELSHLAAWRRALPGSAEPELVEALLYRDWAWAARGNGAAADVTRQAWAAFAYRSEMAAASLEDAHALASFNPHWYVLSLDVGLDQSSDTARLRLVFDEGARRFSSYSPLYRAMLRILMPRWLGSYQQVDSFIVDVAHLRPDWHINPYDGDLALYAHLYWMYAGLEGDEINIFSETPARWNLMHVGFDRLRKLYPRSDYVLNGFARMACVAGDQSTYTQLRPLLEGHVAASAWSKQLPLSACNAKMTLVSAPALDAPH